MSSVSVCLRLLGDHHVSDIWYVQTKYTIYNPYQCDQISYYVGSRDSLIKCLLNTCFIPGNILGPGNLAVNGRVLNPCTREPYCCHFCTCSGLPRPQQPCA